jgi:hypothetical protein
MKRGYERSDAILDKCVDQGVEASVKFKTCQSRAV